MVLPDTSRDVLAYDSHYGWVVCMYTGTFGWVHGWEHLITKDCPEFNPSKWTEMPEGTERNNA